MPCQDINKKTDRGQPTAFVTWEEPTPPYYVPVYYSEPSYAGGGCRPTPGDFTIGTHFVWCPDTGCAFTITVTGNMGDGKSLAIVTHS